MAESGVKVLQVADAFKLSPCRKDRGCPSGVVWSDNLQGYPGNTCTPLARSPRGRHHLSSLSLSIASFRSRRWTILCIRSMVEPCRPYIPLPVFLFVVDLQPSGLAGMMACEFRRGVVSRLLT